MKTAILCVVFLIVGAIAGAAVAGYAVDRVHKTNAAKVYAGDLGSAAMQAELIKLGEVAIVLDTLERALPRYVVEIHKNELLRDSLIADTAMMATKRFYVCTGTSIPEEIGEILKPVALAEDACPSGN